MYLYPEQKSKYKIMSRKQAEDYCQKKHKESSIIISIRSSWDKILPILYVNKDNNVKNILYLSFDDINIEDNPDYCMQQKQGKRVAAFVNKYYDNVDKIIVHCDGGISRSAGVTAAIMRAKEGDDYPVFDNKNKHPNMTCYLMTLKGFKYI